MLNERDGTGALQTSYVYGNDLIKQRRAANDAYYHYDGLGSTRALSNTAAAITDTYAYDAYGQISNSSGSTQNNYLFAGEQFDAALDNYYLRARYYDPAHGRFTTMDTFPGIDEEPLTLNKYLYSNGDPVNNIDPSGNFSIGEQSAVSNTIARGVVSSVAKPQFGISAADLALGKTAKAVGTAIILASLSGDTTKTQACNLFVNGDKESCKGDDCGEKFTECLDSGLASKPGPLKGHNVCFTCRDECERNGGLWPSIARTFDGAVRCDYWNF